VGGRESRPTVTRPPRTLLGGRRVPAETGGLRLERGESAATERWHRRLRVFCLIRWHRSLRGSASALRLAIPVGLYFHVPPREPLFCSLPLHCPHSTLLPVLSPPSLLSPTSCLARLSFIHPLAAPTRGAVLVPRA
jgi:hypothetical protein